MTATRVPMDARLRARRHEVMRERVRRRRRLTVSVVVLVLLAVAGAGLAQSSLFDIVDVRVTGVQGEEAERVRETAAVRPGDNLLHVDLRAAAARVTDLAWVREATARRIPPSTVAVEVTRREPVAVIRLPDAVWLVDADGIVVAGGSEEGLVEVTAASSVLPGVGGEVHDAALRNALAVRAHLPAAVAGQVARYEATSARDLRLHLAGGVVVRFGAAEQVEEKARAILLLLEQVRIQAERRAELHGDVDDGDAGSLGVTELDVRAPHNPVIVPATPPSAEPAAPDTVGE